MVSRNARVDVEDFLLRRSAVVASSSSFSDLRSPVGQWWSAATQDGPKRRPDDVGLVGRAVASVSPAAFRLASSPLLDACATSQLDFTAAVGLAEIDPRAVLLDSQTVAPQIGPSSTTRTTSKPARL